MTYTMHNIVLPNGRMTIPGKPILAETREVKDMIAFATAHYKKGATVVDLGAGEGGYSIAFARAGFRVIAVEPREENIDKMRRAMADNTAISFFPGTIEEYLLHSGAIPSGSLVLCLGLLYHLPDPARTLADISRRSDALILSTHYALAYHWQYDLFPSLSWLLKRVYKRLPGLFRYRHYGLSKLVEHRGRQGRWYPEYSPNRKDVRGLTHSSFHNHRSFWLTLSSIYQIANDAGLTASAQFLREEGQGITAYFLRNNK